jgi:uncharacterized protein (UPF0548 family)
VTVEQLDAGRVARLRAARLTYAEVGQTAGTLPRDYRRFTRTTTVPAADFEAAAHDLLHWQVHRRAGLRVAASGYRVTPGAVVVLGVGIGPVVIRAACRVIYVVEEPRRRGFAYGTLPGHPESGEEAFLLRQHDDGTVTFTITAFSRPASTVAKLAGPLNRLVQDAITARYVRAVAGRHG